jgi:hypothetical protein
MEVLGRRYDLRVERKLPGATRTAMSLAKRLAVVGELGSSRGAKRKRQKAEASGRFKC